MPTGGLRRPTLRYVFMLEALGNLSHEEHEQFVRWLARPFDDIMVV